MFEIGNFFSVLILLFASIWCVKRVIKSFSHPDMVTPVIGIIFCAFVIPVFLDFCFDVPLYSSIYSSMNEARVDDATSIIYNLYISVVIVVFGRKIGDSRLQISRNELYEWLQKIERYQILFYAVAFIPIVLAILSPNRMQYFSFGMERLEILASTGEYQTVFDMLVKKLSMLSIFCLSLLWCVNRMREKNALNIFLSIIILVICILQGKRSLFFLSMVFYFGLLYWNGTTILAVLRRVLVCVALFAIFFLSYGKNIGGSFQETYVGLRIDFGRDDVCKYVIKKVLLDEGNIVKYPGQSVVLFGTLWIFRDYWPEKPWPYPVYLTQSLLPESEILRREWLGAEYLGWGVTTSIVDEAISNFRWLGMLFPFLAVWGLFLIQRLAFIPRCAAYVIFTLLLGLNFVALYPIMIIFLVSLIFWGMKRRMYDRDLR